MFRLSHLIKKTPGAVKCTIAGSFKLPTPPTKKLVRHFDLRKNKISVHAENNYLTITRLNARDWLEEYLNCKFPDNFSCIEKSKDSLIKHDDSLRLVAITISLLEKQGLAKDFENDYPKMREFFPSEDLRVNSMRREALLATLKDLSKFNDYSPHMFYALRQAAYCIYLRNNGQQKYESEKMHYEFHKKTKKGVKTVGTLFAAAGVIYTTHEIYKSSAKTFSKS